MIGVVGDWTPWTQPARPYFLVNTLTPSFGPLRKLVGQPLFASILDFKDDMCTWYFRSKEAHALGVRMLDLLSIPWYYDGFLESVERSSALLSKALTAGANKTFGDAEDVLAQIETLLGAFADFYRLGAFVEPVQIAAQSLIEEGARARVGSDVDVSAAFAVPEASFMIEVQTEQVSALRGDTSVESYCRHYGWTLSNYLRSPTMTSADFYGTTMHAKESSKAAADRIESSVAAQLNSRSALLREKVDLMRELDSATTALIAIHDLVGGVLLDRRKQFVQRVNYTLCRLFEQLSGSLSLLTPDDLALLLPSELRAAVLAPASWSMRVEARRERMLVYQADISVVARSAGSLEPELMIGPAIAEGADQVAELLDELDSVYRLIRQEFSSSGESIRGSATYFTSPSFRGKVAVVRDPLRQDIEIGDILVAPSTTPDYMHLISKCGAMIVDWGGETSHAAVTSRELRKPCLIGTKNASYILRDGELVEIDFKSGAVRRNP